MKPVKFLAWMFTILAIGPLSSASTCSPRFYGSSSFICLCTSEECDTIAPVQPLPKGSYILYTSDKESKRFDSENGNITAGGAPQVSFFSDVITINIKSNEKQQEIVGFGGAFTDAATMNMNLLGDVLKEKLLQSYFGANGIEYNLARVPIGGTDFSDHGYSYDDTEKDDPTLEHFSLQKEDFQFKIPAIKRAMEINSDINFLASVWTAPKWMKTNGQYTGGAIKKQYYQTWANYFIKFFDEYQKHGISFWAVTTGNEPSLAIVNSAINTVGWFPTEMRQWIGQNFGPTIRNSSYKEIKILTLDDQRFFLPWWPERVIKDEAAKYVDGLGLHWYWDFFPSNLIDLTHKKFPNLLLLATESCRGDKPWERAVVLGDWSRAEDYAHGILQDLNHHVRGWIDWNLALNMSGGPTYIHNEVDSPIIVNENGKEFYKQPIYYVLGHFSKFIPRGSFKIAHDSTNSRFELAAFERPDGGIVVVLHNRKNTIQDVVINDTRRGHIKLSLVPKSISTLLYW